MIFLYVALRRLALAALPLVSLLTLWSVGCGQEGAEPQQETQGTVILKSIDPSNLYAKSLDQMISRSDVIVRASLLSATAATETLSGSGSGSRTYRPVQKLRFTVHEYIKGSGPSEVLVVVRPRDTHSTEEGARKEADRLLSQRNTTWDDRQALLLLIRPTRDWYSDWYSIPDVVGGTGGTFVFPRSGNNVQSIWDYAIDTLSRVWLPSSSTEVPTDTAAMEFITDGAKTPHPVISLADFRSQKGDLEALLKAGEGIEGYAECIAGMLAREGHMQANPDWPTPTDEKGLSSGLPSGTEVFREREGRDPDATNYHNYWLSGADMDLFRVLRIDDDTDPKNGYEDALETVRPLPGGVYNVRHNRQTYRKIPCNYKPDDAYVAWTVTVTAPGGTLHELFFDPVAVGTTVAADGSNGVLKPASFTDANSESATIGSISYEPAAGSGQTGTVKLEVDPHTGLANHLVDFIELDGSVSLSLNVAGATVDSANDTLSWSVSPQPWEDGDKLMVRIYKALPAPEGLSVSLANDTFTVTWSAVTGADQYRVGYRTGGSEAEWMNLDATTGTSQAFIPEGGPACGTTYELRVQARGDGTTYIAGWSAPSEPVSHATGSCNRAPVFDSSSYSFSVAENAPMWHSVGTVSATDPDEGDSVVYHITAGNGGGRFDISSGDYGGLILVWGALDYETVSSYTLTVEASDGKAGGASSATVEISVTNVAEGTPSAPDGLSVSLSGDTFTISWSAVTGAGQYRAQHRAGGSTGTWTSLDATTGTSRTFSPEGGLSCGTTYEFRVQAQGDGETHVVAWGAVSDPVSHTTGACNRAPSFGSSSYSFSVSEDAATGTAVGTVSATDPDEGDSVAYSITAGNGDARFSIGGSDGSITVAGSLDYETTLSYTLTVQAIDGDSGTATATVKISVTDVSEAAPPPPTNLTYSYSPAAGSFGFTWHAVAGADMYRVQYRAGGAEGSWTNLEATTSTSHTFIPVGGPLCGTTYEFHIQARGDGETYPANWSSRSGSVTYNTPACNVAESPPPAPQNLTATATHNSVTLSWTAPDDSTVTGYQVLRRRPAHGETELLVHVSDTGSTATTYTDSALQASTRHVYRVKAINAAGVGPHSNRVTATTAAQP